MNLSLDLLSVGVGFGCGLLVAVAVWLYFYGQRSELENRFRDLSQEALRSNTDTLTAQLATVTTQAKGELDLKEQAIREMVNPIREKLLELDKSQHTLAQALGKLDRGTGQLVEALKTPHVRGRWGELQLQRVVEVAGMLDYVDFDVQYVTPSGQRPDMVIKLPGGRVLAIDAKTPLEAYLAATDAPDESARQVALKRHAQQLKEHGKKLGAKAYWEQFANTPEFVVLFVPGENFFAAALQAEPGLIESSIDDKVVLATPTSLIAMLRAVHYGWRQEKLSETAAEISTIGRELFERVNIFTEHFAKVGGALENAAKAYNASLSSLQSRVLVSAKKLRQYGAVADDSTLAEPKAIETQPNKAEVVE